MDDDEDDKGTIIERGSLFSILDSSSDLVKLNSAASIEEFFDLKNATASPISENQETSLANTFNLFSTSTGLANISLNEPTYEVPLINRKRPRDYYFTNSYSLFRSLLDKRDDAERVSRLASAAISGSQILEMSKQPWAAKMNPRLIIRIPADTKEQVKKRRRPSKKERDHKKKVKLELEKQAREEKRYGKFLKFGQGIRGGRSGSFRGNQRGHGGFRGRGNVKP